MGLGIAERRKTHSAAHHACAPLVVVYRQCCNSELNKRLRIQPRRSHRRPRDGTTRRRVDGNRRVVASEGVLACDRVKTQRVDEWRLKRQVVKRNAAGANAGDE